MQAVGVLTGRRLANYELGAPLGEDGFGLIYEALHLNLERTFALRILSDQFTFAQGFEQQFWRVAGTLATLEHANLLTLDDYGVDGPYAYLVTPFVEGLTLDAWLRQRPGQPVGPTQVMRLVGQMFAGLGSAHQAGITHLGLSPRHILIQPNGHLLLANFGLPYLAEQLWIAWNGSRSFGDPTYLAPEQFPGRTPNGVTADLYALGIILYRLLTGVLPFEGSPQALLGAKLEGPPSLRARYPDLPPPLERLVMRALAPAPEDRWMSVAELSETFYRALERSGYLPASVDSGPTGPALPPGNVPLLLPAMPGVDIPVGSVAGPANGAPPVPPSMRGDLLAAGSPPPALASGGAVQGPDGPPMLKAEPAKVVAWSSAGKGRMIPPPPPPAWRLSAPPKSRAARESSHRLVSAILKMLVLLVALSALGGAIFYGYNRWKQLQPVPTSLPTAAPTPTQMLTPSPTPKHRLSFSSGALSRPPGDMSKSYIVYSPSRG